MEMSTDMSSYYLTFSLYVWCMSVRVFVNFRSHDTMQKKQDFIYIYEAKVQPIQQY